MDLNTQYIAREGDLIQNKLQMISEGIHHAEWPYLSGQEKGTDTFLKSLKELHFHIEACLLYINALQEERGIPVMNGY